MSSRSNVSLLGLCAAGVSAGIKIISLAGTGRRNCLFKLHIMLERIGEVFFFDFITISSQAFILGVALLITFRSYNSSGCFPIVAKLSNGNYKSFVCAGSSLAGVGNRACGITISRNGYACIIVVSNLCTVGVICLEGCRIGYKENITCVKLYAGIPIFFGICSSSDSIGYSAGKAGVSIISTAPHLCKSKVVTNIVCCAGSNLLINMIGIFSKSYFKIRVIEGRTGDKDISIKILLKGMTL